MPFTDTSAASREIMWNIPGLTNVILMYALMVVSMIIGAVGIWRHAELWKSGTGRPFHPLELPRRLSDLVKWAVFQRGTVRESTPALFHTLIYFGFLVLLFTTTMVFIDHDLGIRIYHGDFYLWVTIFSDIFGLGLLVGCGMAAYRRYVQKADLVHNQIQDNLLLLLFALLIVQGFALEGLRISVTNDPWAKYSPVGWLVAQFFWPLSASGAKALHFAIWWFHTITVFSFVALIPYSKMFHVVASSANLFFRDRGRVRGALPFPGDLEKLIEAGEDFSLGVGTIKDYSWRHLMDLDACTSCGRCQDNCPAYLSGKPLSPKWLILDSRNHALTLQANEKIAPSRLPAPLKNLDKKLTLDFFLRGSGVVKKDEGYQYAENGAFRARNKLVQNSVRQLGACADHRIAGEVLDPDVFWSCTTCMACVEVCPVGINHVEQIVENRRNMALMHGEIPTEAQATLRALENRGNPFGAPDDRIKWLGDLDVKILKPGDSVDYLYWVGCVSAYDPRKQKIAKALVTLMREAGLSFGILGTSEGCSGDPARRLGEENLFQTLAKKNIETLKQVRFSTLVANCPHCFNTIKNEYPQLGNLGDGKEPEIIHHSQLLKQLLADGRLKVDGDDRNFTFHDPCYLGRYNGEYEAPRETLRAVKGLTILEMERTREKGMCCGAGGGHFWMDLKIGERVNSMRVDQAAQTGAKNIATACPFCMQMMEDGAKLTNRESDTQVLDIAEVLVERLAPKA